MIIFQAIAETGHKVYDLSIFILLSGYSTVQYSWVSFWRQLRKKYASVRTITILLKYFGYPGIQWRLKRFSEGMIMAENNIMIIMITMIT